MIGRLTGLAIERGLDGCCVLDVGGVGYEVFVPLRTSSSLPPPPDTVTLHVHTHVREEALTLYGFAGPDDRKAFRAMLAVSGVGPRLALAILGELSASELASAVALGDRKRFAGIAGVGKKTAERLVLELEGKLAGLSGTAPTTGKAASAPLPAVSQGRTGEVISALVGLGFSRAEAEAAVAKVAQPEEERPIEVVLRQALSTLG